jgi:hypothetical protein
MRFNDPSKPFQVRPAEFNHPFSLCSLTCFGSGTFTLTWTASSKTGRARDKCIGIPLALYRTRGPCSGRCNVADLHELCETTSHPSISMYSRWMRNHC